MAIKDGARRLASQNHHALSIFTRSTTSTDSVINALRNNAAISAARDAGVRDNQSAAIILASPSLAGWLDDQSFMAKLLKALGAFPRTSSSSSSTKSAVQKGFSVLAAVADGLCPNQPNLPPRAGLSILFGDRNALMRESKNQVALSQKHEIGTQDTMASLTWAMDHSRGLQLVTMPLANTLFQNGRLSTLLRSEWTASPDGEAELRSSSEARSQLVELPLDAFEGGESSAINTALPMIPITYPRKISARMGNILKAVEVAGERAPPSAEIEVNIPKYLESRTKGLDESNGEQPGGSGPVGVWALLYPEKSDKFVSAALESCSSDGRTLPDVYLETLRHGTPTQAGSIAGEGWGKKLAFDMDKGESVAWPKSGVIMDLLKHGCRLHRVVSGGGGWGPKKGLLSLDPQTLYADTTSDKDDIGLVTFMEDFEQSRTSEGVASSGNICKPGDWVQFFVTSDAATTSETPTMAPGAYFGVGISEDAEMADLSSDSAAAVTGTNDAADSKESDVEIVPGLFGAVTGDALYLHPFLDSKKNATVNSKISVPATLMWRNWR